MTVPSHIAYDIAHLLDAGVLILSFGFLYQRRLFGILKLYSLQALLLAAAAAWQAYAQEAPHLYTSSRSRCTGSSFISTFSVRLKT
jgi:hydrogenase-4 component E